MGIHVDFLKASADFQKTYGGHPGTKWRVVYLGNCTHFHPGLVMLTLVHICVRTELNSARDEILHVNGPFLFAVC